MYSLTVELKSSNDNIQYFQNVCIRYFNALPLCLRQDIHSSWLKHPLNQFCNSIMHGTVTPPLCLHTNKLPTSLNTNQLIGNALISCLRVHGMWVLHYYRHPPELQTLGAQMLRAITKALAACFGGQ